MKIKIHFSILYFLLILCINYVNGQCQPFNPADECVNATLINTTGLYCGNTTPDAPPAPINFNPDSPNWLNNNAVFGNYTIENNAFYKFVANATTIQFKFCSTNCTGGAFVKGTQLLIFRGSCGGPATKIFLIPQLYSGAGTLSTQLGGGASQSVVPPYNGTGLNSSKPKEISGCLEIKVNNLTIGTTYYIMVDGFEGSTCDYTLAFSSGIVLPVELVSFLGKAKENGNEISWSTIAEPENDYFELISTETGEDFDVIAKIKGNSNSFTKKDYTFFDRNPKSYETYYLLKQVDLDGRYTYKDIISVKRDIDDIDIYPNPIKDKLNIGIKSNIDNIYSLSLYNISGVKIDLNENNIALKKGINEFEINTSNVAKGFYLLEIRDENGELIKKHKILKE